MSRNLLIIVVLFCLAFIGLEQAVADNGHPVAVRRWSDNGFTIETMGNLTVGIGLTEADLQRLPNTPDFNAEDVGFDDAQTIRWSSKTSQPVIMSSNQTGAVDSPFQIGVSKRKAASNSVTSVAVDGVVVVCLNELLADEIDVTPELNNRQNWPEGSLVVIATSKLLDAATIEKISKTLEPQTVIVSAGIEKIGDQKVELIEHNAVAVSWFEKDKENATRFVSLGDQPWTMTKELAGLFAKKEAACKSSREMFAKLSTGQMNFKPGDGSHTPRWNAEHMMGRELLFFSQIFHAVEPAIPVMDLNPLQMPEDYTFAHSDWTGAEEAAQMMRVEAFTRRFAYLLDGMDLDKKSKGSKFWSPRGLLKQMERHYNQHSANVVKKMDLEDWPAK